MLIVISAASLLLVLPTIGQNIDDPYLIAYFNHDEAVLMDLAWYYYSGEVRKSFQYDSDYGLELKYLSDAVRLIPSSFMRITPCTFVEILRWFHLLAWISALVALWFFMIYHFKGPWKAVIAVLLLGTSQAFPYLFSSFLKPDPIVLFFIIVGLHYTLKIMGDHPRSYLIPAVIFASLAFIIKFSGIFLLPAIVIAMYLSMRQKKDLITPGFPVLKVGWLFPTLCGIFAIVVPLTTIFIYKRRLTGLTWFQQFGLWDSLRQNSLILYVCVFGILLIFFSLTLLFLNIRTPPRIKNGMKLINELNSYSLIVLLLFMLSCSIFGFKWITEPIHLINIYAQIGRDGFGYQTGALHPAVAGSIVTLGNFLISKIKDFNPVISTLFIMYLVIECIMRRINFAENRSSLFKRLVLLCFLLPFFPYMFSGGRAAPHIMLPFFVVAVVLSLEGIKMLYSLLSRRVYLRGIAMVCIFVPLAINVLGNSRAIIDSFLYRYHQREDVVFDIVKWFRKTYPLDTAIVADHPIFVYLPPEYNNVEFLKYQYDRATQLGPLVSSFKPKLVYLDMGEHDGMKMPPIEKILPNVKPRLVASFDNTTKYYKRRPGAIYQIYEIDYK